MSEFLMGEPIPEGIDRLSWHTSEREIRLLLAHLDVDGLSNTRERLRSREWHGAPEDLQARRLLLLSDVATALGAKNGATAYYIECGDILREAPDDLSTIDAPPPGEPEWPPLPEWPGDTPSKQ